MSKITSLGLGIVAFEGTEHIKNITYELRPYVNHIVVCLQQVSYVGDAISQEDIGECERLKEVGLIDEILWFEFTDNYTKNAKTDVDTKAAPRKIECDKRNFILDHLQELGCSHSLVIDSDEFYKGSDFKNAIDAINNTTGRNVTYCQYINYWRDLHHYLIWPFKTYVPFITDSSMRYSYDCKCFGFAIDPSRVYKLNRGDNYDVFDWDSIHMHHLSWIRKDISKKIKAWSSSRYFDKKMFDYVLKKYYTWKEFENAIVLFGTPDGSVCVGSYDRDYIKMKYRLDDKI